MRMQFDAANPSNRVDVIEFAVFFRKRDWVATKLPCSLTDEFLGQNRQGPEISCS
jgi:hypothetical protein